MDISAHAQYTISKSAKNMAILLGWILCPPMTPN